LLDSVRRPGGLCVRYCVHRGLPCPGLAGAGGSAPRRASTQPSSAPLTTPALACLQVISLFLSSISAACFFSGAFRFERPAILMPWVLDGDNVWQAVPRRAKRARPVSLSLEDKVEDLRARRVRRKKLQRLLCKSVPDEIMRWIFCYTGYDAEEVHPVEAGGRASRARPVQADMSRSRRRVVAAA